MFTFRHAEETRVVSLYCRTASQRSSDDTALIKTHKGRFDLLLITSRLQTKEDTQYRLTVLPCRKSTITLQHISQGLEEHGQVCFTGNLL